MFSEPKRWGSSRARFRCLSIYMGVISFFLRRMQLMDSHSNLDYLGSQNFLLPGSRESGSCSPHPCQTIQPFKVEGAQMQIDQVVDSIICMSGTTLEHTDVCGERRVLSERIIS